MPADLIASQFQNWFGRRQLMMLIFVFHLAHLTSDGCKISWTKRENEHSKYYWNEEQKLTLAKVIHRSNTRRFSSESQEYMNLLRSEVGAAQSGSGRISGTVAPDMRFSYVGVSVVLPLPWNPHLSSTTLNASPITAAASYRLPVNSCSSSENSSSYLASKNSSSSLPMTINALLNSYADVSETPGTPSSQEQGSSDRSWGKSIKRKKADWENQHENIALIDSWKTHFRALKRASGKIRAQSKKT